MESQDIPHWGKWIKARATVVGFRRNEDFAASVGCSASRLCSWFSIADCPSCIRKGIDFRLIRALKTDRATLFVDFAWVSPEDAPIIEPTKPIQNNPADVDRARRRVLAVVELLPDDGLKKLASIGERMLRGEPAHAA